MTITLYPYQENVLNAIESDPSNSQLISMPTGTGKTITFLSAIKAKNKKCLILVHREELLSQTYEKALMLGFPIEEVSQITASNKPKANRLNIAMVQTLVRNLHRYNPNEIEMVVIDEAHHATAASYGRILDYFKVRSDNKLLLGFTATPLRGDKDCLSSVFQSHSFKMTLSEATQLGYIVPVHGIRIEIDKQLSDIENVGQDYDLSKLDKVMNCKEINELIADKLKHTRQTPALIFCTSVEHAKNIAKCLRDRGRKAISVSYKTSPRVLKTIYQWLAQKRIQFITNAVKLSEGFDHPPVQTVVIARPTRSPVLYKQMIGRGLRNSPNKHECFVMEFSDNDPKMIKWEDIDGNCTFQSYDVDQKNSRQEALSKYNSIFRNSFSLKIVDVRISYFRFYECFVRRLTRFKNQYFYSPNQRGFCVFELQKASGAAGLGGNFFHLIASMVIWQDKYKSFYFYTESKQQLLYDNEYGATIETIKRQMMFFIEKQDMGIWYPSELEPPTHRQKHLMKTLQISGTVSSARKAEMLIEDTCIKRAINKYWLPNQFTEIMLI